MGRGKGRGRSMMKGGKRQRMMKVVAKRVRQCNIAMKKEVRLCQYERSYAKESNCTFFSKAKMEMCAGLAICKVKTVSEDWCMKKFAWMQKEMFEGNMTDMNQTHFRRLGNCFAQKLNQTYQCTSRVMYNVT